MSESGRLCECGETESGGLCECGETESGGLCECGETESGGLCWYGNVNCSLLQDSEAEIAEIFAVRLLSVTLVGASNDTIPPTLGPNHVANVTITSNDSPEGILTFTQDSYTVEEGVAWVNVTIVREQGRVGVVSAIYFSTNGLALNGDDYIIDPVNEVIFSNGQSEVTLAVAIVDDNTPEEDETFCLGIRLPRFGASIGNISESKSITRA